MHDVLDETVVSTDTEELCILELKADSMFLVFNTMIQVEDGRALVKYYTHLNDLLYKDNPIYKV